MNFGRWLRRLRVGCPRQPASSSDGLDSSRSAGAVDSATGWFAGSDRSQSEVLGTVLILGLSMTAIGIALVGGGVALGDLISDAEANNVENGMSHLSSKASLVALGDADSQRFSLGATQEGTVTVRPDAGSMTITHVTNESRDVVNETELGAIVYEGNNREVAYQGGGIWTKRGDNSTMTSPPEFHYRGTTLTLPIIQVTGEGAVGGRTQGQITPVDVGQDAVTDLSTPLENGTVEIEIQSSYYEGWYAFLSQRTDGETELFHRNQTVVTTLTVPDEKVFDTALSVGEDYPEGIIGEGDGEEFVQHRSAKPLIETKVKQESDAPSSCIGQDGDCSIGDNEVYFVDSDVELKGDLDINTSDNNVSIVIDGDLDIGNNDITVSESDPENGVTYYINGSLDSQGSVGTASNDTEADRNVFYVADGFLSPGSGGVSFDAIIYAPDADVNPPGNGEITGSLVANSLGQDTGSGSFTINYDPALSGKSIELTGAGDLLTYLHVSHNEIRVELN